jgi:hypothetical protein
MDNEDFIDGDLITLNNCISVNNISNLTAITTLPSSDESCTLTYSEISPEDYFMNHYRYTMNKFVVTEEDDKIIFVDEKHLAIKCNINDSLYIDWLLENEDNFRNCECALEQIDYIKRRLNKLEQTIFDLTLKRDMNK